MATPEALTISDGRAVTVRRLLGIGSPLVGTWSAILVGRMVALTTDDIAGALGGNADTAWWLVSAYVAAEIWIIPVSVYLVVALSFRTVMLCAAAGFTILGLASALAPSLEMLIVLRGLSGIFGGLFVPLSFMIVLRSFRDDGRREGLACLAYALVGPAPIALVAAGWAIGEADWRAPFLLQAVLGGLVFLMVLAGAEGAPRARFPNRDWLGYLLYSGGLSLLLIVLTQGQRKFWLESPMIGGLACVAAVCVALYFLNALRTARPVVDLTLLLRANFGWSMFLNFFFRFGLLLTAFLAVLFLYRVHDLTVVQIGPVLRLSILIHLAAFPLAYFMASRWDPRYALAFGLASFALAAWLNSGLTQSWALDQFRLSFIVVAVGQPFFMVAMIYEAVYGIRPHEGASATTIFNTSRSLGEAAGVALLGYVLVEREKFHSARMVDNIAGLGEAAAARIGQVSERFAERAGDDTLTFARSLKSIAATVRVEAFVAAFNDVFLVLAAIMLAAALCSLLLTKTPDVTAGPIMPEAGQ